MGTWVLAIILNIFSVPVFDCGCSESGFSRQMSIVKSELANDHIASKRRPLISFAAGPLGSPTSPDFGISRLLWSGTKCRLSIVGNSFYYFCKYTLDTLLETTHCMRHPPPDSPPSFLSADVSIEKEHWNLSRSFQGMLMSKFSFVFAVQNCLNLCQSLSVFVIVFHYFSLKMKLSISWTLPWGLTSGHLLQRLASLLYISRFFIRTSKFCLGSLLLIIWRLRPQIGLNLVLSLWAA